MLSCFVQRDFSSGEEFARKCVWYIPTRDEGAKLLKKLPTSRSSETRKPLSETLPSQETTSQQKKPLVQEPPMSESPKCQERQEMDKFDNWNDYVKDRISEITRE